MQTDVVAIVWKSLFAIRQKFPIDKPDIACYNPICKQVANSKKGVSAMQTSYDAGKKKRYAAWSLLAGFLFAVLLSLTFCAEEADHFCTGEHCAICAQLNLCESVLHTNKGSSSGEKLGAVLHFSEAAICLPPPQTVLVQTLIRLKVKLSD